MADEFAYISDSWQPGPAVPEGAGETVAVNDARMVGHIANGDANAGETYVLAPRLPAGLVLWTCDKLPRERGPQSAADQALAWLQPRLHRVAQLVVTDSNERVSRCRIETGSVKAGQPVYLVRRSAGDGDEAN